MRAERTILIIDNDPALRGALVPVLQQAGYGVKEAASAAEALAAAQTEAPDVLLCAAQLDDGTAFDVAAAFQNRPGSRDPALVIMGEVPPNGARPGATSGLRFKRLNRPPEPHGLLAAVSAGPPSDALQVRLKENEARLIEILEVSTDLVLITDLACQHLPYANRTATVTLGLTETQASGGFVLDQIAPRRAVERLRREAIPQAIRQGFWSGESTLLAPDAEEIPVRLQILALGQSEAGPDSLCFVAQDMSSQRRSERALQESEERYRALVENLPVGLYRAGVGAEGRFLMANPATARMFGFDDPAELLHVPVVDLFEAPADYQRLCRLLEDEGRAVGFEVRMRRRDDVLIWASIAARIVPGGDSAPDCVEGMVHDVTERKAAELQKAHMEVQLRHAQKLESVGRLAAGIAHEINTPIQYCGDNTRFLRDAFTDLAELLDTCNAVVAAARHGAVPPELLAAVEAVEQRIDAPYLREEIPQAVSQVLEGIERVSRIVRAMKEFSHPGREDKAPVDLNRAIENTITVSRSEWKYVAEVVSDLDPRLPPVPCLSSEINQVLLNLIINAAQAIAERAENGGPAKGRISISTGRCGPWAEIRIADTGGGIPENVRSRIFEPFFTTKPVGKGTGQGLAIAHAVVVHKHGGTIAFETEPGRGTTFIIRLPLTPNTAPADSPMASAFSA